MNALHEPHLALRLHLITAYVPGLGLGGLRLEETARIDVVDSSNERFSILNALIKDM